MKDTNGLESIGSIGCSYSWTELYYDVANEKFVADNYHTGSVDDAATFYDGRENIAEEEIIHRSFPDFCIISKVLKYTEKDLKNAVQELYSKKKIRAKEQNSKHYSTTRENLIGQPLVGTEDADRYVDFYVFDDIVCKYSEITGEIYIYCETEKLWKQDDDVLLKIISAEKIKSFNGYSWAKHNGVIRERTFTRKNSFETEIKNISVKKKSKAIKWGLTLLVLPFVLIFLMVISTLFFEKVGISLSDKYIWPFLFFVELLPFVGIGMIIYGWIRKRKNKGIAPREMIINDVGVVDTPCGLKIEYEELAKLDEKHIKPYRKFEPFWGCWNITKRLDSDNDWKVFEIKNQITGELGCLKIFSLQKAFHNSAISMGISETEIREYYDQVVDDLKRENVLIQSIKSEHIIEVKDMYVVSHEDNVGYDVFVRLERLEKLNIKTIKNNVLKTIKLGIDICKALESCENKIIHLNLAISTIYVTSNGHYKLGDFRYTTIERLLSEMPKKANLNFMAPEVFKAEEYDHRADIYSLGLVMYMLLNNGFLPFEQEQMSYADIEKSRIRRMVSEDLPMPINADKKLADIVMKACAHNQTSRYSSASKMRNELENYLNNFIQ